MNIEIRELGSEKYKLLYNPHFKDQVMHYILNHFSFEGLTDIGIKNHTKKLLDSYLDRKQFERKYEPHTNSNAIKYVTDSVMRTAMRNVNDYFRLDTSKNIYSYLLKKEDIKEGLSYDLYCKILGTLEEAANNFDDFDVE